MPDPDVDHAGDTRDPSDPQERPTGSDRLFLAATAALLAAAGIVHLLAARAHLDHSVGHGLAYVGMGVAQLAIAGLLPARTRGVVLLAAAAASGGLVLLWALTLVAPPPFGQETHDLYAYVSKALEAAAFVALALFATRTAPHRPASSRRLPWSRRTGPDAKSDVLAVLAVVAVLAGGGLYGFGHAMEPLFPGWAHSHDHHGHHGHQHGAHDPLHQVDPADGHSGHEGHGPEGAWAVHLVANVTEGRLPLDVEFTVHLSGLEANGTAAWSFDAGDGSVSEGTFEGRTLMLHHTYTRAGPMVATLHATQENASAEGSVRLTILPPEPMQASWAFGPTRGCVPPAFCDGHPIDLSDPRYRGLAYAAEATGALAGAVRVDFVDRSGSVLQAEGEAVPADAVGAFLYTEGPSEGSTFTVELPPGVPAK